MGEAAELMGVSEWHEWRHLAAYREEGAAELAHGNRGRRPAHAIPEETRIRVLELAEKQYDGFNHCHFSELLAERGGLCLSRSTVRRILVEAGMNSPRKRALATRGPRLSLKRQSR